MTDIALYVNLTYNYVMENKEKDYRMTLRIPSAIKDKVKIQAVQEKRSLNAQILYILEKAVK